MFSKYCGEVENTDGLPVQVMRSDHGTELIGEFIKFCGKLGISDNFSAPRAPQ